MIIFHVTFKAACFTKTVLSHNLSSLNFLDKFFLSLLSTYFQSFQHLINVACEVLAAPSLAELFWEAVSITDRQLAKNVTLALFDLLSFILVCDL